MKNFFPKLLSITVSCIITLITLTFSIFADDLDTTSMGAPDFRAVNTQQFEEDRPISLSYETGSLPKARGATYTITSEYEKQAAKLTDISNQNFHLFSLAKPTEVFARLATNNSHYVVVLIDVDYSNNSWSFHGNTNQGTAYLPDAIPQFSLEPGDYGFLVRPLSFSDRLGDSYTLETNLTVSGGPNIGRVAPTNEDAKILGIKYLMTYNQNTDDICMNGKYVLEGNSGLKYSVTSQQGYYTNTVYYGYSHIIGVTTPIKYKSDAGTTNWGLMLTVSCKYALTEFYYNPDNPSGAEDVVHPWVPITCYYIYDLNTRTIVDVPHQTNPNYYFGKYKFENIETLYYI